MEQKLRRSPSETNNHDPRKSFVFSSGIKTVLQTLLKPWNKVGRRSGRLNLLDVFSEPLTILLLILAASSAFVAQEKQSAVLVDQFGQISCDDFLARIDNFYTQ